MHLTSTSEKYVILLTVSLVPRTHTLWKRLLVSLAEPEELVAILLCSSCLRRGLEQTGSIVLLKLLWTLSHQKRNQTAGTHGRTGLS